MVGAKTQNSSFVKLLLNHVIIVLVMYMTIDSIHLSTYFSLALIEPTLSCTLRNSCTNWLETLFQISASNNIWHWYILKVVEILPQYHSPEAGVPDLRKFLLRFYVLITLIFLLFLVLQSQRHMEVLFQHLPIHSFLLFISSLTA